jgi:hypothetical protein
MALEFQQEMRRFLPGEHINQTLKQENLWDFINYLIEDLGQQIRSNRGG